MARQSSSLPAERGLGEEHDERTIAGSCERRSGATDGQRSMSKDRYCTELASPRTPAGPGAE